jgi:16S rRNA (cytosine967-C5)-methyltransferase
LPSFQRGWFYLQDPGTLLAVRELNPQPGETVLDFCAAPGGKATYIAQLMQNQGRLIAQDTDARRMKLLEENSTRLGVAIAQPVLPASLDVPPVSLDRILVDAPCSNTGVLRRRAEVRWRIRPQEIERLQNLQGKVLRRAAALLKPGGTLVYSTCSLEPEENQDVIRRFLLDHPDFTAALERELLPFRDKVDGAFVTRLTRS